MAIIMTWGKELCLRKKILYRDLCTTFIHPFKRHFFDFSLLSKLPNVTDLRQFLKLRKIKKLPFYPGNTNRKK